MCTMSDLEGFEVVIGCPVHSPDTPLYSVCNRSDFENPNRARQSAAASNAKSCARLMPPPPLLSDAVAAARAGVLPMVTVTCCAAELVALEQVSVNVWVVDSAMLFSVPDIGRLPLQPPVARHEVAFDAFHESIVV